MQITREEYERMKAALNNILDISSDEFAKHQARYGLGIEKLETESGTFDIKEEPTWK